MAFLEIDLPPEIAEGASGGPQWKTEIFSTFGGQEARNVAWQDNLGKWEVGLTNKTAAYTRILLNFFNTVRGRGYGFRFRNLVNVDDSADNETIGTGNGTTTVFQLTKRYDVSGANPYVKPIYKIVAGTALVYVGGILSPSYVVDHNLGLVTIATPPPLSAIVTATFQYRLPVRFDVDHFNCQRLDPDIFSWPSIPLIELVDPT